LYPTHCLNLPQGAYTPTESSPIQPSYTLESRGVYTDWVESNQVCLSPSEC
jgi:hypothetical protein